MSFFDHLEDLRWHIIRAVIALVVAAIFIFIFIDWIFDNIIYAPARENFVTYKMFCDLGHFLHIGNKLCLPPVKLSLLINTVSGSFTSALDIAFVGGIIVALPYLLYEFWRFVKPALSKKELNYARGSIWWLSFCFFIGASFGYYVLAPFTFNFLASFKMGTTGAQTYLPTLGDYIDTLVNIILGCGIAFELPVITYVLTKIGIISAKFLKAYRKFAYVIIIIIAAIITPSPDWISQTIVAIPLLLLFEVSILIAVNVDRKKKKEESEWS